MLKSLLSYFIIPNSISLLYERPADATDLFFFAVFGILMSVVFFIWQLIKLFFPNQIKASENIRMILLISIPNIVLVIIPVISFLINTIFGFSIIDSLTDNYFGVVLWTIIIVACLLGVMLYDSEDMRNLLVFSIIILFLLSLIYLLLTT